MIETVQLFGKVLSYGNLEIESGAFRFTLASVELMGRNWITLADHVKMRSTDSILASRYRVPWFRGRLQTLFDFQQSPDNLDCGCWIDDQTYQDRLMLNCAFVAQTVRCDTSIHVPFICTDQFGEAVVGHGALPDRNTHRNQELITSIINAFIDLLLVEDRVNDYDDYGIVVGQRFDFGIRNGLQYNTFLDSET